MTHPDSRLLVMNMQDNYNDRQAEALRLIEYLYFTMQRFKRHQAGSKHFAVTLEETGMFASMLLLSKNPR
jgi:hypothetical protein